jgi:hypothetical protein
MPGAFILEPMKRLNAMQIAAIAYVAADAVHVLDHQRQGRALSFEVYSVGLLGIVASLLVLFLALRRHPVAPLAAAAFGSAATVGVILIHLTPPWGAFSDSYVPLRLDTWSWVSADFLMAAAAALAVTGILSLRRTTGPQPG